MTTLLPLTSTQSTDSAGCGCCGPAESAEASAPSGDAATESMTRYRVSGLSCTGCVNTVTSALGEVPQITSVDIELIKGGVSTITVTGTASRKTVTQAIEQAGYALAPS